MGQHIDNYRGLLRELQAYKDHLLWRIRVNKMRQVGNNRLSNKSNRSPRIDWENVVNVEKVDGMDDVETLDRIVGMDDVEYLKELEDVKEVRRMQPVDNIQKVISQIEIDRNEEVVDMQPVVNLQEVTGMQEVSNIQEVKRILPLTDRQAAKLLRMAEIAEGWNTGIQMKAFFKIMFTESVSCEYV